MADLPIDGLRHFAPPASPLVEAVLALTHDIVRQKYAESGLSWSDFSLHGADTLVTKDDFSAIERAILDSGHRFDWSASISASERPEIYKPLEAGSENGDASFSHPEAPQQPMDADGRALCGEGDNVVRHGSDMSGTARFIRSNSRVLDYLTNGVPPGTIAIIDDSGGTLTAPIIEQFAAVICAGGTVRSHLGILTREYNIPCVMNAKIAGIEDGDVVTIESSADAKTTEDYQLGTRRIARVWRHRREGEA